MNESSLLGSALGEFSFEGLLVVFMLAMSVFLVAVAFERLFLVLRLRLALGGARKVVSAARSGDLAEGLEAAEGLGGLLKPVFHAGLQRALGDVRGDASMAMKRELARLSASLKSRMWILATAGALMPFVGLFGTVLGVMGSFEAIGESGQGGFAVVSVGISQALIATAVGIAVALEGVVLYNVLQSMATRYGKEVAFLVDELQELILVSRPSQARSAVVKEAPHAGSPQ